MRPVHGRLEAQQASVRSFIASQGWTPAAEHQDIASGKDDRRPGFLAALTRCRQGGAVLVAARLNRITRRTHTLLGLLEEGVSVQGADMPGADELMMQVYAAIAQKERELISERTRVAVAAVRARGAVQSESWATQRSRYMTLETIGPVSDTPSVSLPAAAILYSGPPHPGSSLLHHAMGHDPASCPASRRHTGG
jgi:DNA invertase Pin-like site-specific DNA recombinase